MVNNIVNKLKNKKMMKGLKESEPIPEEETDTEDDENNYSLSDLKINLKDF